MIKDKYDFPGMQSWLNRKIYQLESVDWFNHPGAPPSSTLNTHDPAFSLLGM